MSKPLPHDVALELERDRADPAVVLVLVPALVRLLDRRGAALCLVLVVVVLPVVPVSALVLVPEDEKWP